MNRRNFGLLASASAMALKFGYAQAQSAPDASLLKTTLTPMGGERAGNADGSIPAWDGGYTQIPAGWSQGDFMPDVFASEQPVVVITASNMAQYADKLSEGVMEMMTKYGFSIKVYPTHRTAAAPQEVYDNIAANLSRAQLNASGARFGFVNAFGGVPFAIPNISDPLTAGAQIIWNHCARWEGNVVKCHFYSYVMNSGNLNFAVESDEIIDYPYYKKGGDIASFDGALFRFYAPFVAPAALAGSEDIVISFSNPHSTPNMTWELLNGQGRVRKAPEVSFDTPDSYSDGVSIYDDSEAGFDGSLEKYDWKYIGKKEMYIPYNCNGLVALTAEEAHLTHFINPDAVRWELHRVWVVEATVHPGERNIMARRMMYVDEDTWQVGLADMFDASNNLYHVCIVYNKLRPELPGVVCNGEETVHNMQTGDYTTPMNNWNEKAHPTLKFVDVVSDSLFDPNNMAASAQY